MKQIDHAALPSDTDEENVLKKLQAGLQSALKFGTENVMFQAEEALATQLGRTLDNHYVLVRNVTLVPGSAPVPMILIGPTGLWVINVNGEDGLYQALGESWIVLNKRTQQFQPASVNLIRQTLDLTQAFNDFINQVGDIYPTAQPILFFSHPGAHIDASQPAVRIVRMDGVERLIGALMSGKQILDGVQIQEVVDALAKTSEDSSSQKVEVKVPEKDEFWREESKQETQVNVPAESVLGIELPPALKKLRLTDTQWLTLVVMAGVEILILIAFLFFIFLAV